MTISFLDRNDGRISFDSIGDGPLVVCLPGMGDLRSSYRHVAPAIAAAGYRVVTADLRGHGDSDTSFSSYDDEAAASDLIALVERLGGRATLVGNSMAAGASVIAAATRPELVSGLVLLGPFVRNPPMNAVATVLMRALFGALMAPPWAAAVWKSYYPSLNAGQKPADFAEYIASVSDAMKRPGHAAAFSKTTRTNHDPAEAVVASVTAPALVLMGSLDPDFKDPAAEAAWIGEHLNAEIVMVPEAGHYPQSQRPDVVLPAMLSFLNRTANA